MRLKDICSLINYGTVPTSPYTDDGTGTPYIKGMNLKNLTIETTELDRITNTQDLSPKYYTQKGDIVISQMELLGIAALYQRNKRAGCLRRLQFALGSMTKDLIRILSASSSTVCLKSITCTDTLHRRVCVKILIFQQSGIFMSL